MTLYERLSLLWEKLQELTPEGIDKVLEETGAPLKEENTLPSTEDIVDEIIEKYHIHTPVTSTDIENIIKVCGLRLVYAKCIAYPKLDYDENDNPVIVVDKHDYHIIDDLMYYKVDILHEIGKYLFGDTGYGQFARAILMPKDTYLQVVKDNMDTDKDNRRYFDIVKVAGYFHVPQLEVINRGIDLRVIDIVV